MGTEHLVNIVKFFVHATNDTASAIGNKEASAGEKILSMTGLVPELVKAILGFGQARAEAKDLDLGEAKGLINAAADIDLPGEKSDKAVDLVAELIGKTLDLWAHKSDSISDVVKVDSKA